MDFPEMGIQHLLGAEVHWDLEGAGSPQCKEGLWARSHPAPRCPTEHHAVLPTWNSRLLSFGVMLCVLCPILHGVPSLLQPWRAWSGVTGWVELLPGAWAWHSPFPLPNLRQGTSLDHPCTEAASSPLNALILKAPLRLKPWQPVPSLDLLQCSFLPLM